MARDEQDQAEALDADKVSDQDHVHDQEHVDDRDHYAGEVAPDYPPDRALGVDQYGNRPVEEQIPEQLSIWVHREEPDDRPVPPDAPALRPADDGFFDEEADLVAREWDLADDPSAEESALHEADPPPYRERDSYLDDQT